MYNILISGVGGQGSLLASRILGALFTSAQRDVKLSEVHGMSQRGGSVVTYVRAAEPGECVASPIIPEGEADMLIAFEQLEALRWIGWLKKDGIAAVNTRRILPMPVLSGAVEYPPDVIDRLKSLRKRVIALDALDLAKKAGDVRAVNVVMLGAASNFMDFSEKQWMEALHQTVTSRFISMNEKAFILGRKGE